MQGSGPVLMENYLRKYDGPRPSTTTGRRSIASRGRPSTAADRLRRPGTADSIRSVGSRGSYGSNFSNASTALFLDRFATADGKEKRLLMMQKKMELNEAMQKRVQIDHRRSCTPDMLRKLSSQVDRMVSAEDLAREDLDGDDSVLRNSELMNRMSGRVSVAEVMDNPLLNRQMREMTSTGLLERPMTSSTGLRSSASLPNVGRRRSAGRTLPLERPKSRTHSTSSRPWAQGSRQGGRSRVSGDSLVTTLKSRLDQNGITRKALEEMLQQEPVVQAAGAGNCHIADLENALRSLGFTFSNMEKIYVKKTFPGGGPNVHYQGFLEQFWPTGQKLMRGSGGSSPLMFLNSVTDDPSKVESVLRNQLSKMEQDGLLATPPAMVLMTAFQAADKSNKGAIRTASLHQVFRQFGFDVSDELVQMVGLAYCQNQNPKLMDYHRFISSVIPPALTMEDRDLDKSARFFGGESEKGPYVAAGGPDITGSFFDVSEKIKEEAKGSRQNLTQCFQLLDANKTGKLSLSNFRKALSLLRVDLSEHSIRKQFDAFISRDQVNVRRVMDELFPADEDFVDDSNRDTLVDAVEKEFRKEVQRKWGSVLSAFRAIARNNTKSIDKHQLAYCLKNDLGIDATPQTVDSLFKRFDTNNGGSIDFAEFMELFSEKSTESNLLTTKNVTEVQNKIRESIESHLDGSGGGGLLKAYKFFDRDRSGELTYDEIAEGIAKYANVNLEGSMLAKLMQRYDPENSGTIDFNKFVHNVMGSSADDGSSVNRQSTAKAGSRASNSWTVQQLEQGIKQKMERSWTQIHDACRTADVDNSNTISREELRGLLEQFCFVLSDDQFNLLADRLNMVNGAEVSYEDFMRYFARLGGTYYQTLSADMSVADARKAIQEKISSKLTGGPGGLLRAFKMFDRDRSGGLDYQEFTKVLREVAMIEIDPGLSDRLMASYDVDGDGTLDYHEFVQQVMGSALQDKSSFDNEEKKLDEVSLSTAINRRWDAVEVDECLRKKLGERPGHIKRLLNSCDNQRNGTCTTKELRTILRKNNLDMTESQFEEVLSHFDIVDDHIQYEDFIAAYVDAKPDTVPRDVSIINDISTTEAKQLIQDAIKSRLGTGQSELLRAFKFFDRDRSGTIGAQEFQEAMKVYAMLEFSDELAARLMEDFDEDGNGEIDYQEFTTLVMGSKKEDLTSLNTAASTEYVSTAAGNDMMMLRRKVRSQWKDLLQAFRDVDVDKSGTLDDTELRRVLHRFNIDIGESQFAELMRQIDEDRDGEVSYAEFMKFFGKGQAEDRILHTVVKNVTLKQAQSMLADKVIERYGHGPEAPASIKKVFGHFDSGKSGLINVDDFTSAMVQFAGLEFEPKIITEMLQPFSQNGKIDYQHFVKKGLGDSGSTGFDVGTRKFAKRRSSQDGKPQSPPMDAPANPVSQADTAVAGQMLQLIAQKVEAKSRNIAVTFRNFDADKSGSVDYDEFRQGLMHLGVEMTDSDFAKLLAIVDNDKSGSIDYQEFVEDLKNADEQTGGFLGDPGAQKKNLSARVSIAEPAPIMREGRSSGTILSQIADKVEQKAKNIRVVFRNFDEDKSGSVDYQEFRKGLEHLGIILTDADFQTLIDAVDNDKSGCINYAEFVEDLKHPDEQTDGFVGHSGAQKATAARAPPTDSATANAAAQVSANVPGRSGATVLQQIAEKVEQKSKNVRVVFRNFDEDKSGTVDYQEFRKGLAHMGITLSDADFHNLLEVVDNDKSGCINYQEFVEDLKHTDEQVGGFIGGPQHAAMAKSGALTSPPAPLCAAASGRSSSSILHQIADKVEQKAKNVRVVFRNFDEDKSGHVDYVEFRRGLTHLGIALSDADFQTLLDVVDNDKSGTIDYNEFVEDLKHLDEQVGDIVSHDSHQKMMKARQRPQPRQEIGGSAVSGVGANALSIEGSGM